MTNEDLNLLLFCSFRYALGRQTFVVNPVANLIVNHKDELTAASKNAIIEDIRETTNSGWLQANNGLDVWARVSKELSNEL